MSRNYEKWMLRKEISEAVIPLIKDREFAFLSPIKDSKERLRFLKVWKPENFSFFFGLMDGWFHEDLNCYYSCARYDGGIPMFPFPKQRMYQIERKERVSVWKKEHWKSMISYDFLIDIELEGHSKFNVSKLSALAVMDFLDECRCPYYVKFSGKGFHIIVPSFAFPRHLRKFYPYTDKCIFEIYNEIKRMLISEVSDFVDNKINHDALLLIKLPFSLVHYGKDTYISLPLVSREEIENCSLDDFRYKEDFKVDRTYYGKIFNGQGTGIELLRRVKKWSHHLTWMTLNG